MPERISTKLGVEICLCASVHPWNVRRSSSKYLVKVCLRKFVKFPKKVQKNGNPKGLLASLHGVFMGSTCLKSSPCVRPNFRADLIDSPFLSSGSPLCLEGFQPTVYVCTLKNINIVFFSMLQSGKFWVLTGQIRLLSGLIFLLSPYAIRKVWSVFRTHLWAFWPYLVFFGFFAFSVGKTLYQ